MCLLASCASQDASSNFHKRIGIFRAGQLANEYLVDKKLSWGEPVSTRVVEDYVVFYYAAPRNNDKAVSKQDADHVLYVDIHNGEVSEHAHL